MASRKDKKKKKKKKKLPSGPKGAPEWIVTFTDMISLLVTFFVLLMTFSSMDVHEAVKVEAWLTGKPGIHRIKGLVLAPTPEDDLIAATDVRRGSIQPHTRPPDKLPESLEEMGQRRSDEHLELRLDQVADGLLIEFGAKESFRPGSAALPAELRKSLGELGRVFENYSHLIVVEGFTDVEFKPTRRYPNAQALSFARAAAAAEVMLDRSRMQRDLMQVAGLGDSHPRADDATVEGRTMNRRVQIRVLSLSKLRTSHIKAMLNSSRSKER